MVGYPARLDKFCHIFGSRYSFRVEGPVNAEESGLKAAPILDRQFSVSEAQRTSLAGLTAVDNYN